MNIYFKEIVKSDLQQINQWRNDPEIIDLLGNNYNHISYDVDYLWFNDYLKNRDKAVRLSIFSNTDESLIGNVQLTNIHNINRTAEFSILIGNKNYWGKGVGDIATKHMLNHGFNNLNLNRIYLTVLDHNERAVKLYHKHGFAKEGILQEAIYKNNHYQNLIMMAILKNNYKENGKQKL